MAAVVYRRSLQGTEEFIAEYYRPTRPHGSGSGELTEGEVRRLLKIYGDQAPDWLSRLCKGYNIPIPD
jgi:hypothetical protein